MNQICHCFRNKIFPLNQTGFGNHPFPGLIFPFVCSFSTNNSLPAVLSFSDNSEKLKISDLSSTSSTSETDSTFDLHYISAIPGTGLERGKEAELRKKRREER